MVVTPVRDFSVQGWNPSVDPAERARFYCQQLEQERILLLEDWPFDFPQVDREFLLSQRQSDFKGHKNISYRPVTDVLRGASATEANVERLHGVMRNYSRAVVSFASQLLAPYASRWQLDYASFRPLEEKGRVLPLHKRNDLLHVDAFPSRPTRGGRILRIFSNIHPERQRVWITGDKFENIARRFAARLGINGDQRRSALQGLTRGTALALGRAVGLVAAKRSDYDRLMLRLHDLMKEDADFQQNSPRVQTEFKPGCTWLVYTDSVPHAALSGQFALEQTIIVPMDAMVEPQIAPLRSLEKVAGRALAN